MNKFKAGQKYTWTSWFTGGQMIYTIIERTDNELTLVCVDSEIDGIYSSIEKFNILKDKGGNEQILMCEYYDEKGYVTAQTEDISEDEDIPPSAERHSFYCDCANNKDDYYSPSNPWDAPGMSIKDFI